MLTGKGAAELIRESVESNRLQQPVVGIAQVLRRLQHYMGVKV